MYSGTETLSIESAMQLAATDAVTAKAQLKTLSADPNQANPARLAWAFLLSKELNYAGALELVQAVLDDDPNHIDALYNEAYLCQQLGELDTAANKYATLFEVSQRTHTLAALLQGICWRQLGQLDKAKAAYIAHLTAHNNDPNGLFLLAHLVIAMSDRDFNLWAKCMSALKQICDAKPQVITDLINFLTTHDNTAWQRVDHKAQLSDMMAAYYAKAPDEPTFFPKTFVLPEQASVFEDYCRGDQAPDYWMLKPVSASGGQNIALTKAPAQLSVDEPTIVQQYIHDPMLLSGHKFNVRCYVVILQQAPLTACLWHNAVVFSAPAPFGLDDEHWADPARHVANPLRHLHQAAQETAPALMDWQTAKTHLPDPNRLWQRLQALAQQFLKVTQHADILNGRTIDHVKILGFHVTFDAKGQPYLLKVERFPGLGAPDEVSNQIKHQLINDVGRLLLPPAFQAHVQQFDTQLRQAQYDNTTECFHWLIPLKQDEKADHDSQPTASESTGAPIQSQSINLTGSRLFASWLAEQNASLVLTTYDIGKVFLIGLQPDGKIALFNRTFNRCMGISTSTDTIWMSSLYQLWRFENVLSGSEKYQHYDKLYVPQVGYTTGDIDIHDIGVNGSTGEVVFVSTLFSCLATVSETKSFTILWKPPFISKIAAEDRCHLNGLGFRDGQPRYVTMVSQTDVNEGWREHCDEGGIVMDITTNEVLASGLSMPHSPRWHDGKLWLLNAGKGEFGYLDPDNHNAFTPIAFCPGFARGLQFLGDYAVIGVSKSRHNNTFSKLPLQRILDEKGITGRCGIQVVNLKTGDVEHQLMVEGELPREIYDVGVLANVRCPMALGFANENEIGRMISIDDQSESLSKAAKLSDETVH